MGSKVSIRIAAEEYDLFRAAIPDEPRLPASYDEWLERTLEEDAKAVANGIVVYEMPIKYETFANYARDAGVQLSYPMLLSLAVAKATQHR